MQIIFIAIIQSPIRTLVCFVSTLLFFPSITYPQFIFRAQIIVGFVIICYICVLSKLSYWHFTDFVFPFSKELKAPLVVLKISKYFIIQFMQPFDKSSIRYVDSYYRIQSPQQVSIKPSIAVGVLVER